MNADGNDILNSNTRRVWELHQHILWKWGVYCLFKHRDINVPQGIPEHIIFMVPQDSTHRYEIEEFLKHELEGMKVESFKSEVVDWPGTKIEVFVIPFSGVKPYLDRDAGERIAEEGMKLFRQMLAKIRKESEQEEDLSSDKP